MSLPCVGPKATSTLVLAARKISNNCAADSKGFTGLAMPTVCAPYKATNVCGNKGSNKLTTSPAPTPSEWNKLPA